MLLDSPEVMVGWKTPLIGQDSDVEGWVRNPDMINLRDNLLDLKTRLLPSDSILDVGCHAGYFKDYLKWGNYVGIDLFPEHIEIAKKLHPDGDFRVGDLFDMKETADVVICSRVLIHIPDFSLAVEKLLQATKRMLVLILKLGHADKIEKWEYPLNKERKGWFWQREFSRDTINEVLGECQIASNPKYANVYKYVNR